MSHDAASYDDVEPKAPGMYFLRDELNCDNLGVTVVEADAGWEGMEHDHESDGQEEVYLLLSGAAKLTVEDETVSMDAGDAVRVDAGDSRMLLFEADDSRMVIAGAP